MKQFYGKLLKVVIIIMTLGFISCHKEVGVADLSSVENVTVEQRKISSDITSLSETDAIIVAEVFANSDVATRSFGNKQIKEVVTITDNEGDPAIYAVNFDD